MRVFSVEIIRMKPDDKVKLREVFGPLQLFPDQHFGSRKILKVFMIYNNVNKKG